MGLERRVDQVLLEDPDGAGDLRVDRGQLGLPAVEDTEFVAPVDDLN
jgi:hypothetical protein